MGRSKKSVLPVQFVDLLRALQPIACTQSSLSVARCAFRKQAATQNWATSQLIGRQWWWAASSAMAQPVLRISPSQFGYLFLVSSRAPLLLEKPTNLCITTGMSRGAMDGFICGGSFPIVEMNPNHVIVHCWPNHRSPQRSYRSSYKNSIISVYFSATTTSLAVLKVIPPSLSAEDRFLIIIWLNLWAPTAGLQTRQSTFSEIMRRPCAEHLRLMRGSQVLETAAAGFFWVYLRSFKCSK